MFSDKRIRGKPTWIASLWRIVKASGADSTLRHGSCQKNGTIVFEKALFFMPQTWYNIPRIVMVSVQAAPLWAMHDPIKGALVSGGHSR